MSILTLLLLPACDTARDSAGAPVLGPCALLDDVGGDVRYVLAEAPSGGDGSADAPFASLSDALAAFEPGWDLRVGAGEWDDAVNLDVPAGVDGTSIRGCTAVDAPDLQGGFTVTGDGDLRIENLDLGALVVDGASVTLDGNVDAGTLDVRAGTLRIAGYAKSWGPMAIGDGAALEIQPGALLDVVAARQDGVEVDIGAGASVVIDGELHVEPGVVAAGAGTALAIGELGALVVRASDLTVRHDQGVHLAAGATLDVAGSLTVESRYADGLILDGANLWSADGSVNLDSGGRTLLLEGGATATLGDAVINGTTGIDVSEGVLDLAGDLLLSGGIGLAVRAGGEATLSGSVEIGDIDETGLLIEAGGSATVTGSLAVAPAPSGIDVTGAGSTLSGVPGASLSLPGATLRVEDGAEFAQGSAALIAGGLEVSSAHATLDGAATLGTINAGDELDVSGTVAAEHVEVGGRLTLQGELDIADDEAVYDVLEITGVFDALPGSRLTIDSTRGATVFEGGEARFADTTLVGDQEGSTMIYVLGQMTVLEGTTFQAVDAIAAYAQAAGLVQIDGDIVATEASNAVTADAGGTVAISSTGSVSVTGGTWALYSQGGTITSEGRIVALDVTGPAVQVEGWSDVWIADLEVSGAVGVAVYAADSVLVLDHATIRAVAGVAGHAVEVERPGDGTELGDLDAADNAGASLLVSEGSVQLGSVSATGNAWTVVQQSCEGAAPIDVSGLVASGNGDDAPHLCDGTEISVWEPPW